MANAYLQATRPLTIQTALPADTFVVTGMDGHEGISEVYRFEVNVISEHRNVVSFEKLLGQSATLSMQDGERDKRYFSGIVCAVQQDGNGAISENDQQHEYTQFRLSIVPKLWLLSKRRRSRIFQRQSVPDILKAVLDGCNADFKLSDGNDGAFKPLDYCVQYRESDLDFAKRLMEEEGIFFFFKHEVADHRMIVTDSLTYVQKSGAFLFEQQDSMKQERDRIYEWRKRQEIQAGKYSFRDFHFELPDKDLAESKAMQSTIQVGTVTHKLTAGGEKLEIYDYPGNYAGRYDGITKDGGDQAANLQHIFDEAKRFATLAMQREAASAIQVYGRSSAAQFAPGMKFELQRHFQDNGEFVITSAMHKSEQPIGTARQGGAFNYRNEFTCIPAAAPYHQPRLTPTPVVHGTHSAIVVGPTGEEIFTDKYGRVKVQFRWDREGTFDSGSSCWVRVASTWVGKNWGAIHVPRIGQEVVVAFEEGNPNQPIVVGSVFNAENMPPYTLPDKKTQSGIKSRSTPRGSGSNELRFEDKLNNEEIFVHAERDLISTVEHDETRTIKHDRATTIANDETKTIQQGNEKITLEKGSQTLTIQQGDQKVTLSMGNQSTSISLGKSETEAMQSIELKVGQSSVKLDQSGVTIKGLTIKIEAELEAEMKGVITRVNGDGMLMAKGGIVTIN